MSGPGIASVCVGDRKIERYGKKRDRQRQGADLQYATGNKPLNLT